MPVSEQLKLPSSYGSPSRILDWASVEQRLVDATRFGFEVTDWVDSEEVRAEGGLGPPKRSGGNGNGALGAFGDQARPR